jgi:hypothetical protein
MSCDVCGAQTGDLLVVGRLYEDGDEEMNLCESCAALVFPGFAEMMRCSCAFCDGPDLARFN